MTQGSTQNNLLKTTDLSKDPGQPGKAVVDYGEVMVKELNLEALMAEILLELREIKELLMKELT